MAIVNPEMIVLAREARGVNQKKLANAIGISPSKLSKYENCLLEVNERDLRRISVALNFSISFFNQRDSIYGLGSSALFHRKRKRIPVSVQKQVQGQVNVLRMQVDRLLRSVEVDTNNDFRSFDIDEYDGNAEHIAQLVRSSWRIPVGPLRNLTEVVERAGGIVIRCSFPTSKIDGVHLWVPGLPPMFLMNSALSADRYRFSLAHEVGHAVMHKYPSGDIEKEADRFAAELLMPANEIAGQLRSVTLKKAAALKPHWRVAISALIYRARDLGCITQRQFTYMFERLSALGYKTNEPVPIKMEEPRVITELIRVHRETLGYSNEDLADLVYCREGLLVLDSTGWSLPKIQLAADSTQSETEQVMFPWRDSPHSV